MIHPLDSQHIRPHSGFEYRSTVCHCVWCFVPTIPEIYENGRHRYHSISCTMIYKFNESLTWTETSLSTVVFDKCFVISGSLVVCLQHQQQSHCGIVSKRGRLFRSVRTHRSMYHPFSPSLVDIHRLNSITSSSDPWRKFWRSCAWCTCSSLTISEVKDLIGDPGSNTRTAHTIYTTNC